MSMFFIKFITNFFVGLVLIFHVQMILAAELNNLDISLPDLGQPTNSSKVFDYNVSQYGGSLVFKAKVLNNRFVFTPEYNLNSGVHFESSLSSKLSNKLVLGLISTGAPDKNEVLINTGIKLSDDQRLILTFSQLRQKLNISSLSGVTENYVTQYSHAFNYKYLLPDLPDSNIKVSGYISDIPQQGFKYKTNTGDISDLPDLFYENESIAGSKMIGLRSQLSIHPTANSQLKLAISNERLEYKNHMGSHGLSQYVSNIKWSQSLNSGLYLNAGFKQDESQKKYKLGLVQLISKRQQKVGLNLVNIHNINSIPDEKQIQISYSYKFGGKYSNPSYTSFSSLKKVKWSSKLEDKVVSRPSFIPSYITTY